MSGIDGPMHRPQPPVRNEGDVGSLRKSAEDRSSLDKDRTGAGGRERPAGDLARDRNNQNATAQREAFHAAIAKTIAAPPPDRQTAQNGEKAGSDTTELALILPSATNTASTHGAAPAASTSPAVTAERVAALEALALRIEGELDVALRVSTRTLGGGLEVRLALDSAKLGFSGVNVTMRGGELSVQLVAAANVNDQALAASAQALAASLSNRFPQRVIRVERVPGADTDEPAETPTIANILARRC